MHDSQLKKINMKTHYLYDGDMISRNEVKDKLCVSSLAIVDAYLLLNEYGHNPHKQHDHSIPNNTFIYSVMKIERAIDLETFQYGNAFYNNINLRSAITGAISLYLKDNYSANIFNPAFFSELTAVFYNQIDKLPEEIIENVFDDYRNNFLDGYVLRNPKKNKESIADLNHSKSFKYMYAIFERSNLLKELKKDNTEKRRVRL